MHGGVGRGGEGASSQCWSSGMQGVAARGGEAKGPEAGESRGADRGPEEGEPGAELGVPVRGGAGTRISAVGLSQIV